MEKKELEQLEKQMQSLMKKIMDKIDEIDYLDVHSPKLAQAEIECETLEKEYENISSQYELGWQKMYPCSLHIWYVLELSGNVDNTLGICQCLHCKQINRWHTCSMALYDEIEEEQMIYIYQNIINQKNSAVSYELIRQEFLELEDEGYSYEEIREILYNKYTKENEDLARNLKMKYMPKHGE